MDVAALYVDPRGPYPALLGTEQCWTADRDARTYAGTDPVVAHPPCQLWVNLAAVNWKRYGRELPAWYPGGSDGGCFAAALDAVQARGGILEHPAGSHAWDAFGLAKPNVGWTLTVRRDLGVYWVCEVWQNAYGHRARKRTWLAYFGRRWPFELDWAREPGAAQIGRFDTTGRARNRAPKPVVAKRAASATPIAFAETLIALAQWSRGNKC